MVLDNDSVLEVQKGATTLPLYCTVAILFIHNISLGISFYFTSVTVPYHKDGSEGYLLLTEEQISWYLSLHQLAVLIGSFLGNPCGERVGRKAALLISNVLTMLSYAAMFFAQNFELLLTGRLVSGIAAGMGLVLPIVYLGELSTIKLRSGMANSVNLFIVLGSVMIYVVNMVIPHKLLPFVPIGLSGIFLIASFALNESPQWLIRTGRLGKAAEVLRNIRGREYEGVDTEIEEVLRVNLSNNQTDQG